MKVCKTRTNVLVFPIFPIFSKQQRLEKREKRPAGRFFLYKKGRTSAPLDIYRRKREIFIKCGEKNRYLWYPINVIAIQNIQKKVRK